MAIAHIATTTATTNAATSLVVAKPAGIANGDTMIAALSVAASRDFTGVPTGWTLIQNSANGTGGSDARVAMWYRVVDGTEGADFTWDVTNSTRITGSISAYSGMGVLDVSAKADGLTVASASHVAPSVTTTVADTLLLSAASAGNATAGGSYTPPGSMTERADVSSTLVVHTVADEAIAASGATGTRTLTLNSSKKWAAISVAFRTAAGGDTALAGSLASVSSAASNITTQIKLAGNAGATSVASGSLVIPIVLIGSSAGQASADSVLTTAITLTGISQAVATSDSSITTLIKLAGVTGGVSQSNAVLLTALRWAVSCQGQSDVNSQLMGQIRVSRSKVYGPESYEYIFGTTPRITYKNNDKLNRNPKPNGST